MKERVNNELPGQTVKGRGYKTEKGRCFGNVEALDDYCNTGHI